MKWIEKTYEYMERDSLEEWQHELVALIQLSNDVNNGGYIQFLVNNGRETYVRASRALHKVGALKTAAVVDMCQALIEKHFSVTDRRTEVMRQLLSGEIIGRDEDGTWGTLKLAGSVLPDEVLDQLSQLSWEYIEFPEDWPELVKTHYAQHLQDDHPTPG